MAEVLSQNEIDALLQAVSTGDVETEPSLSEAEKNHTDWIAYDLTSQEKIVKGKLVALQGIHERFCQIFRTHLSSQLKKNISVKIASTDFIRFGDYLNSILLPCSINIVHAKNISGYMLVVFPSKLTYAFVDAYYGGSERPFSKIGGKDEFTPIENALLKKVTAQAIKNLEEAWRLNYPIQLQFEGTESNPTFVGQIHASETVAVISLDVEFENLSGPLFVIIQVRPLEAIEQSLAINLTAEINQDKKVWHDHWMEEIMQTELEVSVTLGRVEKKLSEIQSFKVGQELVLDQDSASTLKVEVEGLSKFEGLMGLCRGNQAIRLI